MIQFGILVPLAIGGVASALWREYKKRRDHSEFPSLPNPLADKLDETKKASPLTASQVYDDVGELHHYQRVSWYALVFAASGSLFYAPVALVSIPLLGYNAYHFLKIIQQSTIADRKAPLTIFELIGVVASLATGRLVTTSVLLLFSVGTRKLLLQAGNISNTVGPTRPFNPKFVKVWVLQDGAEVEAYVSELQEGDIIVLYADDIIVVKGKIVEGSGKVRQFSLRKQMKLVPKHEGDKVFPFTQLESGCLHVKFER